MRKRKLEVADYELVKTLRILFYCVVVSVLRCPWLSLCLVVTIADKNWLFCTSQRLTGFEMTYFYCPPGHQDAKAKPYTGVLNST